MSPDVILREVGLRDGLQLVTGELPTERKIDWIRREAALGVREIEVTSFVPASAFPIFADARAVVAAAQQIPGLLVSVLTPNLKGAAFAMDAGVAKINYVVSASEAHSIANVRRSTAEAIEDFARIVSLRQERGLSGQVQLSCGVATAFGCTIQGAVEEGVALNVARRLVDMGADEVMLADTVGYADPTQVERMFETALRALGDFPLAAHFHDTRGLGLVNIAAAARAGIRRFDASLGGLGGCPHAPGATGNVDFEDAAFLIETMGLSTGLDLEGLIALRKDAQTWLPEERFAGALARSGLPKTFIPKPQASFQHS